MRIFAFSIAVFGAISTALAVIPAFAQDRDACPGGATPPARVAAVDGVVQATLRSGETISLWLGDVVCPGERITTGADSRVELQFAGANTTTGASSNTTLLIPAPAPGAADLEISAGVMRFISSVRGFFMVRTPFQDAGIEGTEAVLAVDGAVRDSLILVAEGPVSVTDRRDPAGDLRLAGGEASYAGPERTAARATADEVPAKFRPLLLDPEGASDWAIHYPPILLASGVEAPAVRRAADALEGGEPDRAEAMLVGVSLPPRDAAAALALRAIIAVFRNSPAQAMALADAAAGRAPELGAAHVARSYALQAAGRLESAREAAETAVEASPDDAYAWARLAELHLTLGERRAAREAVERSLALTETALGRTIQGFAELSAYDHAAAREAFRRALEIDSEAPLPRLGLGLSAIRQGRLEEGRRDIEIAVALDPRRARLRTWLGRAYFEEGRGEKALSQFQTARREDPDDPNAYLFAALQLFGANRPIEALERVEAAQDRLAGRAVVRSRAGLAEDRAVQGAALGRLYDTLGLEQLAVSQGSAAVEADPSNPEAHRFLADIFRTRREADIVQTSELLKSDLLSPPSKTPLQTTLVEAELGLLDTTGPTRVTFAEFAPLFDSNGVRLDARGLGGTQDTLGEEVSVALLHDQLSLKLGQFYFETDGYRENNELEHFVLDAQAKLAVTPWLSLFGEYRRRRTEGGDREINFDIDDFDPSLHQEFDRDVARFGFHLNPHPDTDLIGVFTHGDLDTRDEFAGLAGTDIAEISEEALDFQLSAIQRIGDVTFTLGGSYTETDVEMFNLLNFPGFPPFVPPFQITNATDRDVEQHGFYGYANFTLPEPVDWVIGASYDVYDDPDGIGTREEVNPKIGARVRISDDLSVRAAYTQTLKPRLVSEQLLEPTTVMGFSQFSDVTNGAEIETLGGAVDARLADTIRVGVEGIARWWDNPVTGGDPWLDSEERVIRGYAQKIFGDRWALTVAPQYEEGESDFPPDLEEFELVSVPVTLRYFHPSGFFGLAGVEPVVHSFEDAGESGDETFVMVDAAIGWRLPDGRGILSLEAQNLLDTTVRFQDRTFRRDILQAPRFAPELTVVATATLRF